MKTIEDFIKEMQNLDFNTKQKDFIIEILSEITKDNYKNNKVENKENKMNLEKIVEYAKDELYFSREMTLSERLHDFFSKKDKNYKVERNEYIKELIN